MKAQKEVAASDLYYVRCTGQTATNIGGTQFIPGVGPMPVPKEFYERYRNEFDHYELVSEIIAIDKPGKGSYKTSHKVHRAMLRNRDESEKKAKYIPPKGFSIPIAGQGARVPRAVAEAAAESRIASANLPMGAEQCVAQNKAGARCGAKPKEGATICIFHTRMINQGKEVFGIDGEQLTEFDLP
jgi:hypothetical protein